MWWSSVVRNLLPHLSPSISGKSMMSDTTFWLVWYNLLIQTGSNSSKQTWFLVSWLQHSKLNWFELTGKGQMKYLSTGTQSKACYQWHNPNHLDCVTTTMYGDQNPNWYLDCVSSVNPLDSDPSNTFGLWHPCPLVCVGTNSLDSVSFPMLRRIVWLNGRLQGCRAGWSHIAAVLAAFHQSCTKEKG